MSDWRRAVVETPSVQLRVRATTTGADILILSLLVIQCALGLLTIPFSAQHMDGSEMMKLVGWAQSVVTFHGGASQHLDGGVYLPSAPGVGDDVIPAVPVLASGTHLECPGGVSGRVSISWCALVTNYLNQTLSKPNII